jgi:hypothetical protein
VGSSSNCPPLVVKTWSCHVKLWYGRCFRSWIPVGLARIMNSLLCLWLIARARRWLVDSIDRILPWLIESKEKLVKYG